MTRSPRMVELARKSRTSPHRVLPHSCASEYALLLGDRTAREDEERRPHPEVAQARRKDRTAVAAPSARVVCCYALRDFNIKENERNSDIIVTAESYSGSDLRYGLLRKTELKLAHTSRES